MAENNYNKFLVKEFKRKYTSGLNGHPDSDFIKNPSDNADGFFNGYFGGKEFRGIRRYELILENAVAARAWVIRPEFPIQEKEYDCIVRVNYLQSAKQELSRIEEIIKNAGFE